MLEVQLEAKYNLILGSHDYWHRVEITWPWRDYDITPELLFKILENKNIKLICHPIIIKQLYHSSYCIYLNVVY